MTNEIKSPETSKIQDKSGTEKRIEGLAWALFFIWVGIAFLAKIEESIGLLGIGIITLGAQAVRYQFNLKLEIFWLVVGTCFVLGALWEVIAPNIALVPILLIIAGIALFYSAWNKKGPEME